MQTGAAHLVGAVNYIKSNYQSATAFISVLSPTLMLQCIHPVISGTCSESVNAILTQLITETEGDRWCQKTGCVFHVNSVYPNWWYPLSDAEFKDVMVILVSNDSVLS